MVLQNSRRKHPWPHSPDLPCLFPATGAGTSAQQRSTPSHWLGWPWPRPERRQAHQAFAPAALPGSRRRSSSSIGSIAVVQGSPRRLHSCAVERHRESESPFRVAPWPARTWLRNQRTPNSDAGCPNPCHHGSYGDTPECVPLLTSGSAVLSELEVGSPEGTAGKLLPRPLIRQRQLVDSQPSLWYISPLKYHFLILGGRQVSINATR